MQVRISKKYLKRIEEKNPYYSVCVIAPPETVPELNGYVLKILMEYVSFTDKYIHICKANEWNKKKRQEVFIFGKEVTDPEHRYERYKYTAEELERLYSNSMQMSFKDWLAMRRLVLEEGPGKLVKASFTDASKRTGKKIREGWFVLPDADARWAYPISYDPVLDMGKIWKDATGFTIQEEYTLPDISILREHKEQLEGLLAELDRIRHLHLNPLHNLQCLYIDSDGMYRIARSAGEALAITCYSAIPNEVTQSKNGSEYFKYETSEGEQLRIELAHLGTEMERRCRETLAHYQKKRIEQVTKEIKNVIGIDVE